MVHSCFQRPQKVFSKMFVARRHTRRWTSLTQRLDDGSAVVDCHQTPTRKLQQGLATLGVRVSIVICIHCAASCVGLHTTEHLRKQVSTSMQTEKHNQQAHLLVSILHPLQIFRRPRRLRAGAAQCQARECSHGWQKRCLDARGLACWWGGPE